MKKTFFIIFLLLESFLFADNIEIGKPITSFMLPDQFNTQHSVNSKDYSMIIVAAQKDMSVMVNDYLKTKPKAFLEDNQALYISDIHSMPSLITKLFALPKMKKYNFSLLLIYEEEQNIFPKRDDYITIIKLKNNRVTSISYENDIKKIFH